MIIKNFELKNKNLKNYGFFLLYGNSQGQILPKNIHTYDELEIIKDPQSLKEIIFNKSFFEQEKLIIINRVSEKIFKFIDEIFSKKIEDVFFILWSGSLDKKSKLRKLFETDKKSICIPFYEESLNVLVSIVQKFMREIKKIARFPKISSETPSSPQIATNRHIIATKSTQNRHKCFYNFRKNSKISGNF